MTAEKTDKFKGEKKRKLEETEESIGDASSMSSYWTGSDSENENVSVSENVSDNEEISVDFDFGNFDEIDYHGLKSLLNQVFAQDIQEFNHGQIADLIISKSIGCTVKVDDNLDPFALITLLQCDDNIPCLKSVFDFILEKAAKNALDMDANGDNVALQTLSNRKSTALLINDRLINMPPQIVPAMFKFLIADIKEFSKETKHIIYISKIYSKVPPTSTRRSKAKMPKTGSDTTDTIQPPLPLEYFQVEDEFIQPLAKTYFDYSLPKQQVSDSRRVFDDYGVVQARRVFILEMDKMEDILRVLEANIL